VPQGPVERRVRRAELERTGLPIGDPTSFGWAWDLPQHRWLARTLQKSAVVGSKIQWLPTLIRSGWGIQVLRERRQVGAAYAKDRVLEP